MKLTLHDINLASENVARMDNFYQEIMGFSPNLAGLPVLEKKQGYAGDVAFVSDGHLQMHLAQKDVLARFNAGQMVNPVARGHIAYRTDDLAAFKAHLRAQNIPFSDWGNNAVSRWYQIFSYDPDGNVILVHAVQDTAD